MPLLESRPTPIESCPAPGEAEAVAFTSARAVSPFAERCGVLPLPTFAVGEATADAARKAGFADLRLGGGDAAALAETLSRSFPPGARILHPSGATVARDLGDLLAPHGIAVRRLVVYETRPVAAFSPAAAEALAAGDLDAVLFMSPKTADSFMKLLRQAGLELATRRLTAFCLSAAIAERLVSAAWRGVHLPDKPRVEEFFALIDAERGRLQDPNDRAPHDGGPG